VRGIANSYASVPLTGAGDRSRSFEGLIIHATKPAGYARLFLRQSEPLRCSPVMMAAAELGNRQSHMKAARSHARAAFLLPRLPCAPGRFRANSDYTPRRLRERRFSSCDSRRHRLRQLFCCAQCPHRQACDLGRQAFNCFAARTGRSRGEIHPYHSICAESLFPKVSG
jgi:hypothetical protein